MEHRAHAMDKDTWVVLRSQDGQLIGASEFTRMATRGKPVKGGGAYPVTNLQVALKQMNPSAPQSGSAMLYIGPVQDKISFEPAQIKRGGGERPINWAPKRVEFSTLADGSLEVKNKAWGNGGNVQFGISMDHAKNMTAHAADKNLFVDASSPLVLDINRNGKLDLIDVKDRKHDIRFDHTGAKLGLPSGWVLPGDGLLVLDINGNGKIDSGRELFGEYSHSLKPVDKWSTTHFDHGFSALAQYDSNKDGKVDSADKIFKKLRIWRDKNSNGRSEKGELSTLDAIGIASLNLKYEMTGTPHNFRRVAGNEVPYLGDFRWKDGKWGEMSDVWFAVDRYTTTASSK